MHRKVLLAGASTLVALGLFASTATADAPPPPTDAQQHQEILEHLKRIEEKLGIPTTPTPTPTDKEDGQLGVGKAATPPDAVLTTQDSTAPLEIKDSGTEGRPKVYDGQGHTVGTIKIRANWVVVQNFRIKASGQYGFDSRGAHVTIQNNDVKGVHRSGDGDLNGITFFGDYTSILYNTLDNFVSGDAGDSHTDAVQTWNTHPGMSSSFVTIKGNLFKGALKDDHKTYIHQCVMAEGKDSTDGGGGGTGTSHDWLIAGNYCTADMKFDDIDNVTVTGNEFAGTDKRVVVVTPLSSGFKYLSDNKVTGTYGSVGVPITN